MRFLETAKSVLVKWKKIKYELNDEIRMSLSRMGLKL